MAKHSKDYPVCSSCGMTLISAADYHPYVACVLYAHRGVSSDVEDNLREVVEYGMRAREQGIKLEDAMRDYRLIRLEAESA